LNKSGARDFQIAIPPFSLPLAFSPNRTIGEADFLNQDFHLEISVKNVVS